MAEISLKQVNIMMECGADFTMSIIIRDDSDSLVDLTGYTVEAQLREFPEAEDYLQFTATHNNSGGKITITMAHEDTASIAYTSGVYDVYITDPYNVREKVIEGNVTVAPAVTKPVAGEIVYLLSFAKEEDFPVVGIVRRIYFSHASNKMYRWNGTNYVSIVTDGEAATVEVGTVTTLPAGSPATVENVGSLTNAKFDFGIPKGDAGTTSWDGITDKPEDFPPSEHDHDDLYYTKSDVDTALSGKSDTDHNHDSRYYTESEVDTLLSAKADTSDVESALSTKADQSSVYTKTQTDSLLSAKADISDLGDLATEDSVNYETEVTNKPALGTLASLNSLNYTSELLTNKPSLGTMSAKNDAASDNKYYVRRNDMWVDADNRYYTEDEMDTKLALKADYSDLGTIASQDDVETDGKPYVRKDGAWEDLTPTLLDKAPVITDTASGDIVTLTDGSPAPVTALSVGVEPVQDLHGYANPWPAGGGTNIWDEQWELGALSTTTGQNASRTNQIRIKDFIAVDPSKTYCVVTKAGSTNGIWMMFYDNSKNLVTEDLPNGNGNYENARCFNNGTVLTLPNTVAYVKWYFQTSYGTTYNNDTALNYPSTATSYSPYANICPITGHTSATVYRTGKNLLDCTKYNKALTYHGALKSVTTNSISVGSGNDQGTVSSWSRIDLRFPYIKGPCTVTLSGKYNCRTADTNASINLRYATNPSPNVSDWGDTSGVIATYTGINTVGEGSFSVTENIPEGAFLVINPTPNSTASSVTLSGDFEIYDLQLELGSVATAYEAQNIQTVTIDLGGTIYGATIDVLTGVMTVTHQFFVVDGTNKKVFDTNTYSGVRYFITSVPQQSININSSGGKKYYSNEFKMEQDAKIGKAYIAAAGSQIYIFLPDKTITTTANANTWFASNNAEFVVPLATPLTVQLSPSTLSLLQGDNNLWASTGSTAVEYRADTKLFIEKLTKPTEDDMTANVNIASGKFFMVGNNLYYSTASIASGEQIVPGTNCTALSLADALNNLNS